MALKCLAYENLRLVQDSSNALKQCIDKRRYRTAFSENNECPKKEKYNNDREQPVTLSKFQKFPKFGNDGLVGHNFLLNIFSKIVPWAVRVQCVPPNKMNPYCQV
jgi:hypothetical protein